MVSANMGTCFPLKSVFPGVKWLGVAWREIVRWLSSGSPLRQGRRGEPRGRKVGTEAEKRPLDQKPQEPNCKEP